MIGNQHNAKVEHDRERDAFLEELGLTVIRIPAADVLGRLDDVMRMLHGHPALMGVFVQDITTPSAPRAGAATPPWEGN